MYHEKKRVKDADRLLAIKKKTISGSTDMGKTYSYQDIGVMFISIHHYYLMMVEELTLVIKRE